MIRKAVIKGDHEIGPLCAHCGFEHAARLAWRGFDEGSHVMACYRCGLQFPTTPGILAAARRRLADGFCATMPALDTKGKRVHPRCSDAVQWSATGAIRDVIPRGKDWFERAIEALARALALPCVEVGVELLEWGYTPGLAASDAMSAMRISERMERAQLRRENGVAA